MSLSLFFFTPSPRRSQSFPQAAARHVELHEEQRLSAHYQPDSEPHHARRSHHAASGQRAYRRDHEPVRADLQAFREAGRCEYRVFVFQIRKREEQFLSLGVPRSGVSLYRSARQDARRNQRAQPIGVERFLESEETRGDHRRGRRFLSAAPFSERRSTF